MSLRLVFLGSGDFAVPSLEALIAAGHTVLALVAQPDRESGRGRRVAAPPTKPVALRHGVSVLQPRRVREPAALEALRVLEPEIAVVVAYGQILPPALLELPRLGCVNVHASLLPRYRGAAPIQWAIARGEVTTGVTTMQLDEGLDTGPILLQRQIAIDPQETAGELSPRLATHGAELLLETLAGLENGTLQGKPQDQEQASLAPILKKQDGHVDWTRTAEELACRVRGFNPWPGMTTTWRGQSLKLVRARPSASGPGEPGQIAAVEADAIIVACGAATRLQVLEVQPESRRTMSAAAFVAGARLEPGARFE
jgi:methionyl-tRNA formyltransferase